MSFFDFFKTADINEEIKKYEAAEGGVLLDVRTEEEYARGRIPGSKNLALHRLSGISRLVPDKKTPLFVYCLSGARSRQATAELSRMGYLSVTDLGGVSPYRGKLVN